jgi:hypothetical protein
VCGDQQRNQNRLSQFPLPDRTRIYRTRHGLCDPESPPASPSVPLPPSNTSRIPNVLPSICKSRAGARIHHSLAAQTSKFHEVRIFDSAMVPPTSRTGSARSAVDVPASIGACKNGSRSRADPPRGSGAGAPGFPLASRTAGRSPTPVTSRLMSDKMLDSEGIMLLITYRRKVYASYHPRSRSAGSGRSGEQARIQSLALRPSSVSP